jgi:LysM repeat protein
LIAQEYYGTTELWWYVASVNNLSSNNIEAGTQLRVPVSTEQAVLK